MCTLGGVRRSVALLALLVPIGCDKRSSDSSGGASNDGGRLDRGGSTGIAGGARGDIGGDRTATGGTSAGQGGVSSTNGGPAFAGGAGLVGSSGGASLGGASAGGASGSGGRATQGGAGATVSGGSGGRGSEVQGCGELRFERDVLVALRATDRISWSDAQCRPRSAAMTRVGGGSVRQYTYEVNGKNRIATGTGSHGYEGFGYAVNHVNDTAWEGQDKPGMYRPIFVGRHHALYEYMFELSPGVIVTLHWLFATGRDHPLVAVHYDLSAISPGLGADTRTPYGDIAWDGDDNAATTVVSGVGWGDRYRFITTTAPLSMNSQWTYTEPNVVPYVFAWADKSDAEMGLVQTQTQAQHAGGGYWFYSNWGKTSENQSKSDGQVGNMPTTWNWTYQINQYELCYDDPACVNATTGSHRLAWGANYGALGGGDATGEYKVYGDDRKVNGYPYQSYSVFMVLGRHSTAPVLSQARQIELLQSVRLTASTGKLATMLPSGVGATPDVATDPPGYDARYSTFNLSAANNQVKFAVDAPTEGVLAPILVLSQYTANGPSAVRINDQLAVADRDYFASVDSEQHKLWITFAAAWTKTRQIEIE